MAKVVEPPKEPAKEPGAGSCPRGMIYVSNGTAYIGSATNDRMADMMEAHENHMVFARKVLEQKAKADERFARRFAQIVEKHDKNLYGE